MHPRTRPRQRADAALGFEPDDRLCASRQTGPQAGAGALGLQDQHRGRAPQQEGSRARGARLARLGEERTLPYGQPLDTPQQKCRYALGRAVVRIPLIADTHSRLIADGVPGDRGHPERGA